MLTLHSFFNLRKERAFPPYTPHSLPAKVSVLFFFYSEIDLKRDQLGKMFPCH